MYASCVGLLEHSVHAAARGAEEARGQLQPPNIGQDEPCTCCRAWQVDRVPAFQADTMLLLWIMEVPTWFVIALVCACALCPARSSRSV